MEQQTKIDEIKAAQQKELARFKSEQQARLDDGKAEQQRQLELLKLEQQGKVNEVQALRQRDLEPMKSRMSRIPDKEFEVLSKAWSLLIETQGALGLAIEYTPQNLYNFDWPEEMLERFLSEEPHGLTESQKQDIRSLDSPSKRIRYYSTARANLNMSGPSADGGEVIYKTVGFYIVDPAIDSRKGRPRGDQWSNLSTRSVATTPRHH